MTADPQSVDIHTFVTDDGAAIRVRRRASPDGPPLIFIHGLAVNVDLWDMPDIQTRAGTFRSLPTLAYEAGYDVWLMNLRGHGNGASRSEAPTDQKDWCVDHFALYDVPAVVNGVQRATGERPIVVANSMGAMSTSAWLQGADLVKPATGAERIVADPRRAAERQALLRGCVLLEFPAALRWPASLYDEHGALRLSRLFQPRSERVGGANYLFEILSDAVWLQVLVDAFGELRLDWARPSDEWRRKAEMPQVWRDFWDPLDKLWGGTVAFLANQFKGIETFQPEIFLEGIRYAADRMKAGVLRQLAKSVRARSFVSALGSNEHDYAQHYHQIDLPLLLILGGMDNIADAQVCEEVFFDAVRSTDKTLRVFDDLGHGEFEYSPAAYEQVYPLVLDWLSAHANG